MKALVEVPRTVLAPGYDISRIIKGGWQLAGGHGAVDGDRAIDDMFRFVEAGITTFDCADIYTGVETLIGAFLRSFRARFGADALGRVQVHTKYVPDLDSLPTLTRSDVRCAVDRSLRRLGVERLDVVQFHWWDYGVPGCLDAARWLDELRVAGKIRLVAATNFDTPHIEALLDAGVSLVSHQVQYSLLDRRPLNGMAALSARRSVPLLCYGAVAGGFLTDRYVNAPPPSSPFANRSLVKYALIIDEYGGWTAFQSLLSTLAAIARKHGVSSAAIAVGWVLGQPQVGGVIVGATHAGHLEATLDAFRVTLDDDDLKAIASVLGGAAGPGGDVYGLERETNGRHAAIMRNNLNRERRLGTNQASL